MSQKKAGNKYYMYAKSVDYELPKDKCVRAKMNIAGWVLEGVAANQTKVMHVTDMDPMGNIPNMMKGTMAAKKSTMVAKLEPIMKKNGY